MKKIILTILLVALLAATPSHAQTIVPGGTEQEPAARSGPYVNLNNVYQTLGECQALPRVTGVLAACGQTLIIKAGGVP
jgi:hypothetical protein